MRSVHSARYRFFIRRLRQARTAAGLSQVEAARALRTTQNTISKCELGDRRVDAVELWGFAALYDKPLEFFLDMKKAEGAEGAEPSRARQRRR